MKNQLTTSKLAALPRLLRATFIAGILPASLLLLSIQSSRAGSATWNLNPADGNWNTATNWTPATVPNGPADTATFYSSNTTDVSTSGSMYGFTEVNSIVFGAGAPAFTIHVNDFFNDPYLVLSGTGVTNNSNNVQTLILEPAHEAGGQIVFSGNATAANLQILDLGSDFSEGGSSVEFGDSSTASEALVTMNGSPTTEVTNSILFYGTSSAGNAILVVNAGIGYGTGGELDFLEDSTGGTTRVKLFGNDSGFTYQYGTLNIYAHNGPGVTVGSIEGSGFVGLGYNKLTVGSNNLSTTFSGVISDVGGSGSLTKIGGGTLTLTGANTYTGGTTVESGKLVVNSRNGSATGTGPVQVNAGTLGGRGIIAGAVTVGTGTGAGAILAPGRAGGKPSDPLTIQSALTFNSDATYNCGLNTKGAIADQVVANGVTIDGAHFSFVVRGRHTIPPGNVFTVINNTAATSISGTFSNLADGSTFIAHGNTFQASYEGGDGNDLTLTAQ